MAGVGVTNGADTPPIAFAGSPIDRADNIRVDDNALGNLMNWRARVMNLDGLLPEFDDQGHLLWHTLADVDPETELVFLGMMEEKAHFAPVPAQGSAAPAMPRAWQVMQMLQPEDLAIYGGAKALIDWHARHQFCAQCGSKTKLTKGGWQRSCDNCGAQHFPRTDPVTIMLVEHEDRLLLGRQPRFPPRMYSALAGFVEPGETIEEAVQREIWEEAGVRAHTVEYIASQPWPFPSQLMIGCTSKTDDPALTIDETELDDARWFTREELEDARAAGEQGNDDLIFPRPFAVAHTLITWWLDK
ncbi:NAD(+) diphosphatase [Erythrobacter sp. YT30]|uniref:NAD(+) diphosphatase n=1 Tax=Erythrobacter sp. YT30 TaxID=1735012 RepID=UPI00076D7FF0|nr:NAD(+) diphosphatase [Erythrobacter sp. YT30]KWV93383.1 NADH pyrophosphatase [Erythrobacter sp. YT30]